MPPIGAQGLNTSFEDIALLIDSLEKCIIKNNDIGSQGLLTDYGVRRRLVTQSKMLGVSVLNKTSKSNLQITKDLRKVGLKIIEKNSTLKKALMKAGLGYI
jgi:2-octaprenyl-6-methoxyphenol hydroxylase